MSYASIAEAHGLDFANQVNAKDSFEHFTNNMNPSRQKNTLPGTRYGDDISRSHGVSDARKRAVRQSRKDRRVQKESFNAISPIYDQTRLNRSEFRPWGDEVDQSDDDLSPDEYLQRSLVGNPGLRRSRSGYPPTPIAPGPPNTVGEERVVNPQRIQPNTPSDHLVYKPSQKKLYAPFNPLGYSKSGHVLEPTGVAGQVMTYGDLQGNMEEPQCNDYFFHLDTCRRCQKKLKKRVARYFKALQQHKLNPLLPGAQGVGSASADRELFSDYDDIDEMMNLARKPDIYQDKRGSLCLDPPSKEIKGDTDQDVEANQKIQEGFRGNDIDLPDYTPSIFLLLFGLLVIYLMDRSGNLKIPKMGNIKIIR